MTPPCFKDEERAHWLAVAEKADRELAGCRAEQATEAQLRTENERTAARMLGIPPHLAPVLGVAIYSSRRDLREKAVEILLQALDRLAREVAA